MGDLSVVPFVISLLVFCLTYAGILVERIHRTIVALSGAVAMIVFGSWFSFYDAHQAVEAIDFNTIALLLGMMIIVGLFKETGFFEYVAIKAAKFAHGKPWLLLVYLGSITAVISMLLDNVTTIIIIVPVTISMADILGMSALPFLMGEVLLSNIGGVATLIGDPPNILIGSASGFSFTDFLVHLAPIALTALVFTQGLFLLIFWRTLVRTPLNVKGLMAMDEKRAIIDPLTTRRMLQTLGVTVFLYFIHDRIGLEAGVVALVGSCLGLLWVRPKLEKILQDIHWDVLLFFAALFIAVGGLEAAGVLDLVAEGINALTGYGMIAAALSVLWIGAIMSAVIDNVPFTIAMLPVIAGLASRGVDVAPLWWALALGVGFGGNATPIGSTASVLTVSLSERTDAPITFRVWIRSALPITFATCIIASVALLFAIKLGLL